MAKAPLRNRSSALAGPLLTLALAAVLWAALPAAPAAGEDDLTPVLVDLVGQADLQPRGLVTLYWGDMLSSDDAASASQSLKAVYDGLQVDVHHGGQPHYEFIVSIE